MSLKKIIIWSVILFVFSSSILFCDFPETDPPVSDSVQRRTKQANSSAFTLVPRAGSSEILLQANFDAIDRHALNAPESVRANPGMLSAYLVKPAENDLEKVRAIFRWITENIEYDIQGYLTKNYGDLKPEGVLRSGRAVCSGYSGLFAELANEAGIEVREISGWAKGASYRVGEKISGPTNHAWNAVKIEGFWYFIESTWGAGHGDITESRFIRRFENYWFLTPPDQFIYTHFPEDPKWQLLQSPISKSEFENLPYLRAAFFKYGLELKDILENVIRVDSDLSLSINSPEESFISVALLKNSQRLPRKLTFLQRKGSQYQIDAVFPHSGDFILRVYAGDKFSGDTLVWATDFKVKVSKGKAGRIGFPKRYTIYNKENAFLHTPKTAYLESGSTYSFRISVPNAQKVALIAGGEWQYLEKMADIFEVRQTVGEGEIVLAALFPEAKKFSYLLEYTGIKNK